MEFIDCDVAIYRLAARSQSRSFLSSPTLEETQHDRADGGVLFLAIHELEDRARGSRAPLLRDLDDRHLREPRVIGMVAPIHLEMLPYLTHVVRARALSVHDEIEQLHPVSLRGSSGLFVPRSAVECLAPGCFMQLRKRWNPLSAVSKDFPTYDP